MKGKSTLKQNLTTRDDIHSISDKLIANIYIDKQRQDGDHSIMLESMVSSCY